MLLLDTSFSAELMDASDYYTKHLGCPPNDIILLGGIPLQDYHTKRAQLLEGKKTEARDGEDTK
ncbi:hypothetical protein BS78_02G106400 [Paspalum vaginatum]|nr:hypothetical protein BS78_02G106400 [Paspalum vaginatum]